MKFLQTLIAFLFVNSFVFGQVTNQPIDINLKAFKNGSSVDMLLTDSLYINLCLGDSVLLTIDPDYINSLEATGIGYSQNDNNVNIEWTWSTGQTFTATDSIVYVATNDAGFISTIKLTDSLSNTSIRDVIIRVGVIPNFGYLVAVPDTVCVGDQTVLYGGYNSSDSTMYGGSTPEGIITIGGSVAGETYLPDITSGSASYQTTIDIAGFDPSQTLTASCGISEICLDIEHSYVSDLDVTITCPDGSIATLFIGNSSYFLGEPYDDEIFGNSGNGYTYCFSDDGSTLLQSAPTMALISPPAPDAGTTIVPGTYIPQNLFSTALAGCPLNGPWTITVTDHAQYDDGYIFEWSLSFDPCNYDDAYTYQTYPVSAEYINVDPILNQTDSTTTTTVQNLGINGYQFHVVDNYGCPYDTTINVIAHFVDVIETDTVCNGDVLTMTANFTSSPGLWSFYGSPATPVFGSNTNVNTTVTFSTTGVYHLIYSGSSCAAGDTAHIYYQGFVPFNFNAPFVTCPNAPKEFEIQDSLNFASVDWNLGTASDNEFTNILPGNATYTVNGIGTNGCPYDTTFIVTSQTPIALTFPNLPTFCGWSLPDTMHMISNTGVEPGQWTFVGPSNGVTFADDNALNTDAVFTQLGTYYLIYTEPTCQDDDTLTVSVTPGVYFNILDYDLCDGSSIEIVADIALPEYVTSMQWNTGATTPGITVTQGGYYTFTIENACQEMTDSSLITLLDCEIVMPNVFTPNGDGVNDIYQIITAAEGIFKNFHITITNRWGNLIKEYETVEGTWDGTNGSGKLEADGVYFYSVTATTIQDEEVIKQGFIHLISQ